MSDRPTLYRSFTPQVEVRTSGDGRTVYGIAVPYGAEMRIDSTLTESFARGAFNKQITAANRIVYTRDHQAHGGQIIGRVTQLRDDSAGLYFEARISPTSVGDDTLTLIRDGVLDQHSIGFSAGQDRRLANGTIERVTATLRELSVVPEGAYGELAVASGVRAHAGEAECPTCSATATRAAQAAQILAGLPVLPPAA